MKTLNTIVLSIGLIATASVFTTVRNFENQKTKRNTKKQNHFELPVSFVRVDSYFGKRNLTDTKNENTNKLVYVDFSTKEISSTDFQIGEDLLLLYMNQKNENTIISDSDFSEGENKLNDLTHGKFEVQLISQFDFEQGEELLIQSIN